MKLDIVNKMADYAEQLYGTDLKDDSTSRNTKEEGWQTVDSPVNKALYDVVQSAKGPIAVGEAGNVLYRRAGKWVLNIDSGPATKSNALTTVDATVDGKRIWFAGSSGALGMYNIETGQKYDYSAPEERTSTWEAIAIAGEAGQEQIRVANGSGEVLPITLDDNGCPEYGDATKPGSGSTISALDFGGNTAYTIDTSGNVFEEIDDSWEKIGIKNAQVNFFDISASEETLLVTGGDGLLYRYDRNCQNWTPINVGSDALYGIDRADNNIVIVGANGSLYRRESDDGWIELSSPVEGDLRSIAYGSSDVVAVGSNGTILEQ